MNVCTIPAVDYVLMTPARDEESNIQRVLDTIAAQTLRPLRWFIIDNGSSDRTADLVEDFARTHDFLRLMRCNTAGKRTFASKAYALKMAYAELQSLRFEFVGNLDADITLPPDYYANMVRRFMENPRLGVVGGIVWDVIGTRAIRHNTNLNSVAGAIQLFRRACYESIGGYFPSRVGGIDTIAEVSARMHGWEVRTFPDVRVSHHREMGTAAHGSLAAAWRAGHKDHGLGYHAMFYFLMCCSRLGDRPIILGGILRWLGYTWQALRRAPLAAPPDVVAFLRREQRARLRQALHLRTTIAL